MSWRTFLSLTLVLSLPPACGGSSAVDDDLDAAVVVPLAEAAPPSAAAAAAAHPANIIFVLTDDLAWNLVPYMPHVLDLQRRGMTFTNYFVTDSLCCPSRSSIFTGKFPHNTGVFTNGGNDGGYGKYESAGNPQSTFATRLQAAGYRTAMSGKFLNGYYPAMHGPDPGWSHWVVAGDGYREFDYKLNIDGNVVPHGHDDADYLTDVLARRGVSFIKNGGSGKPFMIEIATFAPHGPYTPAPRDKGTFHVQVPRTPAYAAQNHNPPRWLAGHTPLPADELAKMDHDFNLRVEAVQSVDDMIGELEAALVATGHDRDTYIVFSSDNGYHMGDHSLLSGKQTAFDTDINVPLVVVGPGVPAGVRSNAIVENIDLCPTFAEMGGLAPLTRVDGHSLLGLLHGQPATDWREFALIEHHGPDLAPMAADDPDNERFIGQAPNSYEAIRLAHAVYVEYQDGETEYYDLTTDPYELDNTAATLAPARASRLHAALAAARTCHGAAACWQAQKLP